MALHIPLEQGKHFQMGKGDSRHLVDPEIGAQHVTMNYSIFQPGHEFPQHFHDVSADIFIVLENGVSVRQGDNYRPIQAGDFAYIPPGEVHGTVNQTDGQSILISFQSPPDPTLYRGERDPAVTGVVPRPPKGHVSMVQVRNLATGPADAVDGGRLWVAASPDTGSQEMTLWYAELAPDGALDAPASVTSEAVWFVWEGAARFTVEGETFDVARRGVVFVPSGQAQHVTNTGDTTLRLIRCLAPA